MPGQITLVCHARTTHQRTGRLADDETLDTRWLQARDPQPLRARLQPDLQWWCAPEQRCQLSARWLLGDDHPLLISTALSDLSMGDWRGQPLKQLDPEAYARWLDDPARAAPGGESLEQVRTRAGQWLEQLPGDGHWAALTHPWVIRALLAHVLQAPSQSCRLIDVLPLSAVRLSRHDRWRLQTSA